MTDTPKNAVVITAIDHEKSRFKTSDWSKYCIASWDYWCSKNNVNLHIISKHNKIYDRPIWNRYDSFDLFNENRLLLVDSDTMVRWDSPNIFNEVKENEIGGILDNGNLFWLHSSISAYKKFFNNHLLDINIYINGGVMLYTRQSHNGLFNKIRDFYLYNKQELSNWNHPNTGRDQTILNYHIQQGLYRQKILDHRWNQHSMLKFGLFYNNWQQSNNTRHFIKTGYIWHFTGIPIETRIEVMKNVWEGYKHKYV